jgi:hypothetical protein
MIQFIFHQSMWATLSVAFTENFLCDIPLVFMFKYSLQVAIIVRYDLIYYHPYGYIVTWDSSTMK